ncbi:MAG: FAD-dependent oxidoreductase [Pseudomonadota bacterium]
MAQDFDFAVVGRGLWGSAAAMYLARSGAKVALIGPDEPKDKRTAPGPFASHYDEGRITRSIATKPNWARWSSRSIARYRDLEAQSGIRFYTPCGGAMASTDKGYMDAVFDTAEAEDLSVDALEGAALAKRLTMFDFAPGTRTALDATGGWINPRRMRQAHETLAQAAGAQVFDAFATDLSHGKVTLSGGDRVRADQILVATGSYAALDALLPRQPVMQICARTVYFAHIDAAECARLTGMPSLIYQDPESDHYIYLLPPIRYPDGSWRIKIGGENMDNLVHNPEEARAWMQGLGSKEVAADLEAVLRTLMPDLRIAGSSTEACILAHTDNDQPFLERVTPWLTMATGCCGAGAKCADELGRLAARLAQGASLEPSDLGAEQAAALA